MKVEIDTEKMKCNFKECQHYEDGVCQDSKSRKDCVEIAIAVLCIKEKETEE